MWRSVLVLALLLAPAAARGQALGLDDVRSLVRTANTDVREAESRILAAEVQIDRAWARIVPQVVAYGAWTRNDREIAIELPAIPGVEADSPIFQHESLLSASLEVQTQLFDPALPASLRGARAATASARGQVEALRERLDLAAIEMFHQLHSLDLLLEAAEADLEVRREAARLVEARRAVDAATDFEVSRSQTDILAAELDLETLREDRRALSRALAELVGLADPPLALAVPADVAIPIAIDVQAALAGRADVRAARLELESAEALVTAARREYLPDLVASGQYRISSEDAIDGENTAWAISFGLRWLIFDRGLQGARVDEALATVDGAAARLAGIEATAEREIRDAQDAVDTAARRAEIAERQEVLAATALDQANVGYAQEVLTSLDVLEAQAALLRARNAGIAAQLERDVAVWRLRYATGDLRAQRP